MRIAVTGANGFIGRALTHELCERGHVVRVIIRSGNKFSDCKENFEISTVNEINADTDWTAALKGVDVVIHLASRVHIMHDASLNPLSEYRKVNTAGSQRLAEMSVTAGVKRFIFVSTIKVNGEGTTMAMGLGGKATGLRQKEDKEQPGFSEDDVPAPMDPYAISKWEAEQALHRAAAATGLEIVILRPPLVYGPGVKANFLSLFKLVDRGIPLPLAAINNRRSFIYLGNLVDAIVTCINHPKADGQTFLVSDGNDVSTPEMTRLIAAALGKPARLFPFPPALMKFAGHLTEKSQTVDRLLGSLVVDSSKIRRELNWTPPYTMQEGLRETAEWFKSIKRQ